MLITIERMKRGHDYAVMMKPERTAPLKRVGTIRRQLDGWAYNPIRTKIYGESFPTVAACLESLRLDQ